MSIWIDICVSWRKRYQLFSVVCCLASVSTISAGALRLSAQPSQSAQSNTHTFEVASIRPVSSHTLDDLIRGVGNPSISAFPANKLIIKNMPLDTLIAIAFGVNNNRLIDRADWPRSQQYDVVAKVEGDSQLTREQMRPLLQQLLEQRLQLLTHRETKVVPGYGLVVAKGGPKLQASKEGQQPSGQTVPNELRAVGFSIASLAGMLESPLKKPVIDKTGIVGTYDFRLTYAPEGVVDSKLPSIFAAIQEQLGLKLESQKVPIDTVVIDHVNRVPTEN